MTDYKLQVYCSSGMNYISELHSLIHFLETSSPNIRDFIKFRTPYLIDDSESEAYVFADLIELQKSDVLLVHIPHPTVGACCELGYFKALKPHAPIIAYKCVQHPWIQHLASYVTNDKHLVLDIFETMLICLD